MSDNHPTVGEFDSFLRSRAPHEVRGGNAGIVRHLLSGCTSCRVRLRENGWPESRLEHLFEVSGGHFTDAPVSSLESSAGAGYNYDSAFSKTFTALQDFFAADRPEQSSPEELLGSLAPLTTEQQLAAVATAPQYVSPQLVRWLVDRSHGARYDDPEKMLFLAQLAQVVADRCEVADVGSETRLFDLRMRAWGQYANALRVSGQPLEAEQAFNKARRFGAQGTGDPMLRARLLEQTASLRIQQQQFDLAIEVAHEAGEIYRELGETHLLASTLVQKAIACLYGGEPERAVRILNRAIPLIDQEDDPHLLLAACHNLVRCYIDLDKPEQGLSLYFKARDLYKEFTDVLILLRAAWQEGQLLRDLGHLRAAETAFMRARKGFMERGLLDEVALVSLDLSAVYVKLGAVQEVHQAVTEMLPIFRSLRVGREALAALLQLQKVAHQELQALELIRLLTSRIEHLSHRSQK
jgi:tetratricopeptide (TPR) repeat protein